MKKIKFKQAAAEQWAELYKAAVEIKKNAPWERLWDSELFTIWLPDYAEPILVSVMGRNGECFGIAVYPGYESIMGYCTLAQADNEELYFVNISHQNCLTCYFGDREELDAGEREIIKQLGYKFRGHNNWIYFRSMKTGYYPWKLDAEQVVFLIDVLNQFLAAYADYRDGRIKVNFKKGQTVIRKFDAEQGEWKSSVEKIPPYAIRLPILTIEDDILIHTLKNKTKTDESVEFDMVYLPFPVQENKDEVPYMPCLVILAGRESGLVIGQHMVTQEEEKENAILTILEDYVSEHGRPSAIYVRDYQFQRYVDDICKKTDIQIVVGEDMTNINEITELMIEHMKGR